MIQEVNSSTNQFPATIDELVDDMERNPDKYKHLKFILHRKKHRKLELGQKYLLVNQDQFGVFQLDMVDYNKGYIQMLLIDPDTGIPSEINFNINNKHPETFLINWTDIEDMVYAERNLNCADCELLELDTD
ncbi:MAG: hypothetical protein KA807_14740 [Prolixibacteraceae bacterium]|jgi:hypothetical protein|nr:hypothetical protein [Prolixibacteraceae bacterium]